MSTHTPTTINEEYDIIIAGGGTAGCVVASRLATADPDLRILVLEAGPPTHNDPAHMHPARFISHVMPGSRTVRAHAGRPSPALGGRSAIVQAGQCLGGGGSVNFMMYTRASASDYDAWKRVHGNAGWGSEDLIPLLKKTVTYQIAGGEQMHGSDGPLKVSLGVTTLDFGDQFLQAAAALDPTRTRAQPYTDTNDLSTVNVYTKWTKWIDAETGIRSDVPHNMIYPLKETRPNLHIVTGVHAKHVTFDEENRATGVTFAPNPLFHPADAPIETRTVRATKLVVLSAGSLGTPAILERSGIGAKDVLERVGVKQRVDSPGVGENYQDHCIMFSSYFAADEAVTLDAVHGNDGGALVAATAEFEKTGKGLITHSCLEIGIKWRPNPSELAELGPEFKEVWDSHYANAPDKPVLWMGVLSALANNPTLVPRGKYFAMANMTEYPVARGHAHITHADDVSAPLDFVPGYLESMTDVRPLMWGYKFTREIARRMPHFRGEPAPLHPAFAPGGPASLVEHSEGPVPMDAPRITYSDEDDRAIEAYVRAMANTTWHSLGTCAMKPSERGGVVDSRLNVYGVQRLKVADLSIAPSNVGANTYSTALLIGEKAAVIIAEELGIKGVCHLNPSSASRL